VTLPKAMRGGAVLQLAAVAALAGQQPAVEQLFPARPTGYVTDVAGLLDARSEAELNTLLERLRAATGVEIAVVTLPTIDDRDEAEVALAIGRKWGVGAQAAIGDPRRNAGMVVLLVPRQNHVPGTGHLRIEVGQGLEGIVPDAVAGRVRRDIMGPLLAREEYGPALVAGVRTLVSVIARAHGVTDTTLAAARPEPARGGGVPLPWWLPLLILFVLFSLAGRLAGRGRRRRVYWGAGPWIGGGWGGGGGGFGGFGGGGGFSGGGSGGRF
jgi:uncharacterized protein